MSFNIPFRKHSRKAVAFESEYFLNGIVSYWLLYYVMVHSPPLTLSRAAPIIRTPS